MQYCLTRVRQCGAFALFAQLATQVGILGPESGTELAGLASKFGKGLNPQGPHTKFFLELP